mgnify:CR=1 FL=1
MIKIWNPRWHDRKVLIATYKVKPGDNIIKFTKCKSLPGKFHITDVEIKKCLVESNGKIDCFAVPLEALKTEKGINSCNGQASAN